MTRCPTSPRTAQVLAMFSIAAALAACGGGGNGRTDGAAAAAAPASGPDAGAPAPAPVPVDGGSGGGGTIGGGSSARVAGVDLVQSFVYPSTDANLLLVANRDVIVKVNVTTTKPAEARPTGTVRVETSNGMLLDKRALNVPSVALAATVPVVPDFQRFYTATVPASAVQPGMKVIVTLANNQPATVLSPRVGASNAITLVSVPVRIQNTTATVFADAAAYVAAHNPVASVAAVTHAPYTSSKVTALPAADDNTAWADAMGKVLGEMGNLHAMESRGDRAYYYGFLPKRSWGITGLGYMPGNAAVGIDFPTQPEAVSSTLIHELGHNFSLPHAPCGIDNPDDGDKAEAAVYPYPNATLGANGRFIWGYDQRLNRFIDPRTATRHDVMSYCDGSTFSDFNYRRIQSRLTPSDSLSAHTGASIKSAQTASPATGPQELLLVSGHIVGESAELGDVKAFSGTASATAPGTYVLRLETTAGTVDYPFGTLQIDHVAYGPFRLTVPNRGRVLSIQVRNASGKVLTERRAAAAAVSPDNVRAYAAAAADVTESKGVLRVRWDAATHQSLTVIHVGEHRSVLTQDATGGSLELPTDALPAGGSFELILSDGLNSVRVTAARGASGSAK